MHTRPHPRAVRTPRAGAALRGIAVLALMLGALFATTACDPVTKDVGGVYRVTYGTAGTVAIHASGPNYTVSVQTPFRIEGATCDLPVGRVIATFTDSGDHKTFTGYHRAFDATTCLPGALVIRSTTLNDDGSISLGTTSTPHLLTKTANTVVAPAPAVTGDYSVMYGTAGAVTVHGSGPNYTVSVKTPFRIEGATCDLPVGRVIATFTDNGDGRTFNGFTRSFNTTTCLPGGLVGRTTRLNSNNTISLGSADADIPHVLVRTAAQTPVANPTVTGDYSVMYGTAGAVRIERVGATYTVTVTAAFRVEGATCSLPADTVIATFTDNGDGRSFNGNTRSFSTTTCLPGGLVGRTTWLNTDNTISLGSADANVPHLLVRT